MYNMYDKMECKIGKKIQNVEYTFTMKQYTSRK